MYVYSLILYFLTPRVQIAFTGPAVSSLSGFKDLRDPTHDLWKKYNYDLWDYKSFLKRPELIWRMVRDPPPPSEKKYRNSLFYNTHTQWPEIDKAVSKVKPNIIHEILGRWQVEGKLGAVITQNYDSANDKAGMQFYINNKEHI